MNKKLLIGVFRFFCFLTAPRKLFALTTAVPDFQDPVPGAFYYSGWYGEKRYSHIHEGLDEVTDTSGGIAGLAVLPSASGVVTNSRWSDTFGWTISRPWIWLDVNL